MFLSFFLLDYKCVKKHIAHATMIIFCHIDIVFVCWLCVAALANDRHNKFYAGQHVHAFSCGRIRYDMIFIHRLVNWSKRWHLHLSVWKDVLGFDVLNVEPNFNSRTSVFSLCSMLSTKHTHTHTHRYSPIRCDTLWLVVPHGYSGCQASIHDGQISSFNTLTRHWRMEFSGCTTTRKMNLRFAKNMFLVLPLSISFFLSLSYCLPQYVSHKSHSHWLRQHRNGYGLSTSVCRWLCFQKLSTLWLTTNRAHPTEGAHIRTQSQWHVSLSTSQCVGWLSSIIGSCIQQVEKSLPFRFVCCNLQRDIWKKINND